MEERHRQVVRGRRGQSQSLGLRNLIWGRNAGVGDVAVRRKKLANWSSLHLPWGPVQLCEQTGPPWRPMNKKGLSPGWEWTLVQMLQWCRDGSFGHDWVQMGFGGLGLGSGENYGQRSPVSRGSHPSALRVNIVSRQALRGGWLESCPSPSGGVPGGHVGMKVPAILQNSIEEASKMMRMG